MSKPIATILQSAICKTNVRHRPSPSLFYFPGLTCGPLYDPQLFSFTDNLRNNHKAILDEYLQLKINKVQSDYKTTEEHKLHRGKWDWNSFILKGKKVPETYQKCPTTATILESISFPLLMSGTPFSFAFFSNLYGNSSIASHFGPCNLRIRCHLPLIVPDGDCGMEVGGEKIKWVPGQPVYFDDSFEHKVWNNTSEERVVLLFDMWHPELSLEEIESILGMFHDAKEKGWLKE